ncbi:MAG: hypothetical protein WCX31_16195 [Salinivirgaceae bacterium]
MKKRTILALMATLMITSVFAQKVIDNIIPIKKANLPIEILDTTYKHYLVEIIYPDDLKYPGLKDIINAVDIYGSVEIPRLIKLNWVSEQSRKDLGIIVTIKFSDYLLTWNYKEDFVTKKYFWKGTIEMPVTISWSYPNILANNFTYLFNYKPNAEGEFEFITEIFSDTTKIFENEKLAIQSLNTEIFDALKSKLRESCQRFYPSIWKGDLHIYTLSDKKINLTKTDEILDMVKRGISLIDSTDIFANPSAAKELNVAIGMYDEMIADASLKKEKYVLLHLYLNKQSLEMIIGNFTDAEQTFVKYKKEVGSFMITALKSDNDIKFERYRCDKLKLAYQ